MNLSFHSILRIIGLILIIISFTMLPSMVVAVIYNEMSALFAFGITMFLLLILGYLLFRFGKPVDVKLKIREGFLILTLCWTLAAASGAAPFVLSGSIPNAIDAFFESCSGFSTTGATVLPDVESLPQSILFWRSFTQWIGGIGILLSAVAFLPSLRISGQNIALSETPGATLEKITPTMWRMAKKLCILFGFYTVVETLLLLAGGMGIFDALLHAFGTVSTGGFSNYNDSIAYFDSSFVTLIILLFMFLGGMNFNLTFLFLRRGPVVFLQNSEFKFYVLIQIAVALFISLNVYFSHTNDPIMGTLLDSTFQTTSLLTTTGYTTLNFNLWPTFSQMLLLVLLFTGSCSSSSGSGIKAVRVLILLRLIRRGVATRLHPQAVVSIKLNGRTLPGDTVSSIVYHFFLFLVVVFISTIILSLNGFDLITVFTSVVTCLGNVGPGFGLAGSAADFSIYAPPAKLLLSLLMVGGRLELFALFILLVPRFWNPNN